MGDSVKMRQEQIISILKEVSMTTPNQLATETQVSMETIRKDLATLVKKGVILKVHGGVALLNSEPDEEPYDIRLEHGRIQKEKIARSAIGTIQSGDHILLEGCTTCFELAKILMEDFKHLKTLTIITNSFEIATLLEYGNHCHSFYFLGGKSKATEHSTRGAQTVKEMANYAPDVAFFSGAAYNQGGMLAAFTEEDVLFQRGLLDCAKQSVLLMESNKFSKTAFFNVAPLSRFHHLITDVSVASELYDIIRSQTERAIFVSEQSIII